VWVSLVSVVIVTRLQDYKMVRVGLGQEFYLFPS
jgi:hypothetical protein